MFNVALDLLRLRARPMADFNFPIGQSVILLFIIGLLIGLDPSMSAEGMPPLIGVMIGLIAIGFMFFAGVPFIGWWLKRKNYWNGEGNLFNILVASSLIDIVPLTLAISGIPFLFIFPLDIYSLWVVGNAIKGATQSSIGYAISGLLLWTVIGFTVVGLVGALIGFLIGVPSS